ncbi:annexin D4-like isoform X2 [Miscanthus floridulus]|uniref:annexin D4-like isoform X2 n=1 Tax=Miscanthus floridulus TaxID=154761 RepID=UPI0034582185
MQQFLTQTGSNSSAATSPPASPQPRLRQQQAPRKERDLQNKEKEAPPAAMADEHQDLTRAFAGLGGLGVDETALVSALGRWRRQPEKRAQFRRGFLGFFSASAGAVAGIERCEDEYLLHLKAEFARFKDAAVLWAMHPWERDARWAHHVLHKAHPPQVLVEVACTRAADDLLGARRAYQALYHRSLEEDVAYRVRDANASLLVGLVSAYRYEGACVSEDLATEEAKALAAAVRSAPAAATKLVPNEQVVRVLATRSKPQLRATFRIYMELHGKPLEEVVKNTRPGRRAVPARGRQVPGLAAQVLQRGDQQGVQRRRGQAGQGGAHPRPGVPRRHGHGGYQGRLRQAVRGQARRRRGQEHPWPL